MLSYLSITRLSDTCVGMGLLIALQEEERRKLKEFAGRGGQAIERGG